MSRIDSYCFMAALLFFAAFVANILLGRFAQSALVGDVGEMILMAISTLFFTAGTLMREKKI